MTVGMINANPVVHERPERAAHPHPADAIDALDVFDTVRDIKDPEHPYSLEQLSVLSEESVSVDEKLGRIQYAPLALPFLFGIACGMSSITFTPTVQHCSMATVIGLCLRLKLMQNFPPHFKIDIKVAPGSLANEDSVNKQLNDKERVAAALENPNLRQLVDECLCSNDSHSH
uniref:MIP18 family-like domain-containing protein n=1 Tax=Oryza punctata TaxID=4537 RepID=A0A0E0KJL9_ORYPU